MTAEVHETMLEHFFTPTSVAVIGASAEPGKVGHHILKNLLDARFRGDIYPVNPKADVILGLRAYKSVLDITGPVDLAVIVIPAKLVLEVMEQCGQKGIDAAVIISAGFKETGPEGAALQDELVAVARRHGIRVIGPNCLGIISTSVGLNASFAPATPRYGHLALLSQSGALATAILDWSTESGIGYNKFFTFGNQADVGIIELLQAWKDDPEIRAIVGYIEDVKDGPRFMEAAEEVSRAKPFVVVKAGGTASGARAAVSHTGSLAGAERAYDAAFRQCGVLRARAVQELFDYAIAFSNSPLPSGPRVGMVTNAGGPGILCTDAIERAGLTLAALDPATVEKLKARLPAAASTRNPVDVLGDAKAALYDFAIQALLEDPGVDGIIALVTPQTSTEIPETAEAIVRLSDSTGKPIFACCMGGALMAGGISILREHDVPNYPFPERAVAAFNAMVSYAAWRKLPVEVPKTFAADKSVAEAAFAKTRAEGRRNLNEVECADILRAYGFALPANKLCASADEAAAFADQIGYPVVMKIASPDILHKSDVGGVKVGLADATAVRGAYETMMTAIPAKMPGATIWGVSVQQMIAQGKEVILGVSRDPQFGPMIMFGLGGIYVEVLKDVTFRIAPLTERDAREMLAEVRGYHLLTGARGEQPADINAVVEAILRLSQLVTDFPDIAEMDINPLMVLPEKGGAVALDSRISLLG